MSRPSSASCVPVARARATSRGRSRCPRRRAADERREDLVRFAERPVARRALRVPDLLAPRATLPDPLRQALEVGAHVDVPGRRSRRASRLGRCRHRSLRRAGVMPARRRAVPATPSLARDRRATQPTEHERRRLHQACTLLTSPARSTLPRLDRVVVIDRARAAHRAQLVDLRLHVAGLVDGARLQDRRARRPRPSRC